MERQGIFAEFGRNPWKKYKIVFKAMKTGFVVLGMWL
jgi:hypothetical protein